MIELSGRLINTFRAAGGTNKKGETYDAKDKIQILGDLDLPEGGFRSELVTLSVDDVTPYAPLLNAQIRVSVGVIGGTGRVVTFFVRKGSKPIVVQN